MSDDEEENQKYYKFQCMLHIPYRGDVTNLLERLNNNDEYQSWNDLYESSNITDNTNPTLAKLEDEGEIPQCIEHHTFQILAQCAYRFLGNREIEELGNHPIDNIKWLELSKNYPSMEEGKHFRKNIENNVTVDGIDINRTEIRMSIEQNTVLEILESQIKYFKMSKNERGNLDSIRKECVVQGRAGCGKSTLIKGIVRRITSEFGQEAVVVTAPTGIAAVNIDGNTCHNKFKFPISNSKFTALEGVALPQFQVESKDLRFVMIDEMSMLPAQEFHQIKNGLSQLRPHSTDSYEGICIYFIGDFR